MPFIYRVLGVAVYYIAVVLPHNAFGRLIGKHIGKPLGRPTYNKLVLAVGALFSALVIYTSRKKWKELF